ncbi:E3 ubiquitin-protein ligase RNF216-like [Agrilus planipennis]|uniref:E3 ubiquitin-protein ligase RNF216-like n=1 Tax=Agrilus planipennis TaxID=224129 RepID=A0A7F5R2Q6_AGRPL|nr:E3 ubiquitin-protein ligase RNF216-like [Agrilus planipennis]
MTERNTEYFSTLREMFPYTDPHVIKVIISLVTENTANSTQENIYERLIDLLIQSGGSPHGNCCTISENQIESWYSSLLKIFPDVCPKFLRSYLQSKSHLVNFDEVLDDISNMTYPKKKPDPKSVLKILKETLPNADPSYLEKEANFLAYQSEQELKKFVNEAIENENYPKMDEYKKVPDNIPLLQEIAFLKNKKLLLSLIKNINDKHQQSRREAIENNLLQTCECCFDDELIPEECFFCNDGCIFCKPCIKKGVETYIGDGKLHFPCLGNCGSEFGLSTLQMVLDPPVFSKMFQRRQLEEIKKANIDGLEMCPFCEFATIPAENDKTFRCENPDCLKESCRSCWHESHIPLACNEIEFDEDVRLRTFIENKMTEALLRECWRCGKKFIKESGCNKMTCDCGAKMCYICKQPIENYKHFSNNPGRCPLYTNDLDKFHENIVAEGGLQAKLALGLDKEPNKLKKDPMENLVLKN